MSGKHIDAASSNNPRHITPKSGANIMKSFFGIVVTEDSQGRQIAGLGFLEESVEVDVEVVQSRNIVLYIVVVFPVDGGHVV